ncbi:MAG: tetratricopeptide repeat protein [Methylococcaceae bacterium]|nr:tetratricopeptide repeat protein [Methylococcaceae bacterium]
MEVYLSEEERLEALKKWWQENSRAMVVGIALGAAVLAGWNAWQNARKHKAEEVSGLYLQMFKAIDAKQNEPATKLAERIIVQGQGTAYATYGALFAAKLKVEAGDLAGAKKVLSDLLASTKDEDIRHISRMRLIQVMLSLNEGQEALKLLEPLKPKDMGEYESRYEELKGDVYAALQRPSEALMAYERAKQLGIATPLLEMKTNNLGVETGAPSPAS